MTRVLAGVSDVELGALLEEVLSDCEIRFAPSPSKVLEEARSGSYDIMLLDVDLCDESCDQLVRKIIAEPTCQRTPVLVLGAGYGPDVELAIQAGASAWVKKPFHLSELRAMVKKYSAWDDKVINKPPKESIKEKGPFVSFEQAIEATPKKKVEPKEPTSLPEARSEKELKGEKLFVAETARIEPPLGVVTKSLEAPNEVLFVGLKPETASELERTFTQSGCKVHVVATGRQCLERVSRGGLDMVLVSLRLADLDGFTVCRRIGASYSLPIFLVLPADAGVEDRIDCWKVGAHGYFLEPLDLTEIGPAVEASLTRVVHYRELANRSAVLESNLEELRSQVEGLLTASVTDPLTGLYNRRSLDRMLEREVARARRFREELALMMLDMDKFKRVNDQFGHRAGDAVLTKFSADIQSLLRKVDMIFRYGGEEFCIILPETDHRGALWVSEKLRRYFEHPRFQLNGQIVAVTLSVGVVTFGDKQWENGWDMVDAADAALLEAKRRGGNATVPFVDLAVDNSKSFGKQ